MQIRIALICLLLAAGSATFANAKTIKDVPEAGAILRRTVSRELYQELAVSPVEGWIVVRGELSNDHLINSKIVRSELDGQYDSMALELANNFRLLNYIMANRNLQTVLLHLVIYRIADGRMALSFAHLVGAGANQLAYSGTAWIALQTSGPWKTVEPLHLLPHERRGPRSYTLAVEYANGAGNLSDGRLPNHIATIQGSQRSVLHHTGMR